MWQTHQTSQGYRKSVSLIRPKSLNTSSCVQMQLMSSDKSRSSLNTREHSYKTWCSSPTTLQLAHTRSSRFNRRHLPFSIGRLCEPNRKRTMSPDKGCIQVMNGVEHKPSKGEMRPKPIILIRERWVSRTTNSKIRSNSLQSLTKYLYKFTKSIDQKFVRYRTHTPCIMFKLCQKVQKLHLKSAS